VTGGAPQNRRVIDHHYEHDDRGDERELFKEDRQRIGGVKIPKAICLRNRRLR